MQTGHIAGREAVKAQGRGPDQALAQNAPQQQEKPQGNKGASSSKLADYIDRDYGWCEKHGQFLKCVHTNGAAYHYAYRCPYCAAEERDRALWGRSGIPRRFQQKTLEGYKATGPGQRQAKAAAHAFALHVEDSLDDGRTLILCGNPGTGKTHLACAIGGAAVRARRSVLFVGLSELIDRVFGAWRSRPSSGSGAGAGGDPLEALASVDLLIIDEIGSAAGSDAEKRLLFQIVNRRYENVRSTILISNLRPDALVKALGERTVDRFRETGEIVAFTWRSYRTMARELAALPDEAVTAQQREEDKARRAAAIREAQQRKVDERVALIRQALNEEQDDETGRADA